MTDLDPRGALSIDQQLSLRTAATRLHAEFDGVFGTETIERFLHTSYDQFATHSTIARFLPLLAERFARQRLRALARVEGHHQDGKPTVLFLCVHNAGRSQMALGFFEHLAGDRLRIRLGCGRRRRSARVGGGDGGEALERGGLVRRHRGVDAEPRDRDAGDVCRGKATGSDEHDGSERDQQPKHTSSGSTRPLFEAASVFHEVAGPSPTPVDAVTPPKK